MEEFLSQNEKKKNLEAAVTMGHIKNIFYFKLYFTTFFIMCKNGYNGQLYFAILLIQTKKSQLITVHD